MRILIVDDNAENLDAAKQAAADCSEHEFQFVNSAKQALDLLPGVDVVITDMFFPNEEHTDHSKLADSYGKFCRSFYMSDEVEQICKEYVSSRRILGIDHRMEDLQSLLKDGGEKLVKELFYRHPSLDRDLLTNPPRFEFPYGAGIMLEAKNLNKRACLVSDIHNHSTSVSRGVGKGVDGALLLSPLVAAGIISYENVIRDGEEGSTYLGENGIWHAGKGKTDPAVWTEAIKRVLSQ